MLPASTSNTQSTFWIPVSFRVSIQERKHANTKVTPEQLAALLRQSANTTPNPAALAAVGATFDKEEDVNDED